MTTNAAAASKNYGTRGGGPECRKLPATKAQRTLVLGKAVAGALAADGACVHDGRITGHFGDGKHLVEITHERPVAQKRRFEQRRVFLFQFPAMGQCA